MPDVASAQFGLGMFLMGIHTPESNLLLAKLACAKPSKRRSYYGAFAQGQVDASAAARAESADQGLEVIIDPDVYKQISPLVDDHVRRTSKGDGLDAEAWSFLDSAVGSEPWTKGAIASKLLVVAFAKHPSQKTEILETVRKYEKSSRCDDERSYWSDLGECLANCAEATASDVVVPDWGSPRGIEEDGADLPYRRFQPPPYTAAPVEWQERYRRYGYSLGREYVWEGGDREAIGPRQPGGPEISARLVNCLDPETTILWARSVECTIEEFEPYEQAMLDGFSQGREEALGSEPDVAAKDAETLRFEKTVRAQLYQIQRMQAAGHDTKSFIDVALTAPRWEHRAAAGRLLSQIAVYSEDSKAYSLEVIARAVERSDSEVERAFWTELQEILANVTPEKPSMPHRPHRSGGQRDK
ncbi:MAG: hypothetical protein IH851_03280 [Armatimonadetes bacterium]|nr:hypothetical protein [Armatimonadota bacterium]